MSAISSLYSFSGNGLSKSPCANEFTLSPSLDKGSTIPFAIFFPILTATTVAIAVIATITTIIIYLKTTNVLLVLSPFSTFTFISSNTASYTS